MSWIFFAIAAPAIYAISNFIDKFLIEKRIKDYIALTVLGSILALTVGIAIIIIRHFPTFEFSQMLLIIAAGAIGELALIPYYKALSLDETSRVTTFFQIIPIFVLILAFVFLGEAITTKQFYGFWFIFAGGFILSLKKFGDGILKLRKSFWWAMFASLLFAISIIIFKFVVTNQNFWDTFAYEFIGAGIGAAILLLIPAYRRRFFAETKKAGIGLWGILGINEVFWVLGRLMSFVALTLAPIALVSVLGGTQPLFILVYGIILSIWFPQIIKEDMQKSTIFLKIIAIALIFGGVWFINL